MFYQIPILSNLQYLFHSTNKTTALAGLLYVLIVTSQAFHGLGYVHLSIVSAHLDSRVAHSVSLAPLSFFGIMQVGLFKCCSCFKEQHSPKCLSGGLPSAQKNPLNPG